jgi:hypothetical protein
MMEPTLDTLGPIKRPVGRPRKRPTKRHADPADAAAAKGRELRRRGLTPRVARRGIDSSERLGPYRWVGERTHSWRTRLRGLKVRYEPRSDLPLAFLHLGCTLICGNFMVNLFC